MKILLSPAKKMNADTDFLEPRRLPALLERTEQLMQYLRSLPYEELKKLLGCNDAIARLNYDRYRKMQLRRNLTPALLSYEGIQYQYMAPHLFTEPQYAYVEAHVRILSGFYGVLRPFDGVVPYRLEMQAKLKTPFCKNLYDFWGGSLFDRLKESNGTIINLASKEYGKAVLPYVPREVRVVTPVFGELCEGKIKEKGVYVKMARGEMVRFMAEHAVSCPEEIRQFCRLGYRYCAERSDNSVFVFLR